MVEVCGDIVRCDPQLQHEPLRFFEEFRVVEVVPCVGEVVLQAEREVGLHLGLELLNDRSAVVVVVQRQEVEADENVEQAVVVESIRGPR